MFVYKWLLLRKIISRNIIYLLLVAPLVNRQIRYKHASNQIFSHCLPRWLSCTANHSSLLSAIWCSLIVWVAFTAASYTQKELNNHNFFKSYHFLHAKRSARDQLIIRQEFHIFKFSAPISPALLYPRLLTLFHCRRPQLIKTINFGDY